MKSSEKKQITDIINAFRLINQDIQESFKIMCSHLESMKNFRKWKKWEKGSKNTKEDYRDYFNLIDGNDWYYLNCYGLYNNKKVIGFTFVISINYEEKEDRAYFDFIKRLDENINLNAPMLCIFGIYTPLDKNKILLVDENDSQYVDDILQFTDSWINYEQEIVAYNKWFDVEVEYLVDGKIKEEYEGWYKSAKVNICHITDISSKENAIKSIDELIKKTQDLVQ